MSDRMSEDMPDRMPERMSERMSEDMPDRMSEDMPDKMPEGMSDRMPEGLPVTKCINVMVGITRSKVFFCCFRHCHHGFTTQRRSGKLRVIPLGPGPTVRTWSAPRCRCAWTPTAAGLDGQSAISSSRCDWKMRNERWKNLGNHGLDIGESSPNGRKIQVSEI